MADANPTIPAARFASKAHAERRAKALATAITAKQTEAHETWRANTEDYGALHTKLLALAAMVAAAMRLGVSAPGKLPQRSFWNVCYNAASYCILRGKGHTFSRLQHAFVAALNAATPSGIDPQRLAAYLEANAGAAPRLPDFEEFIGLTAKTNVQV